MGILNPGPNGVYTKYRTTGHAEQMCGSLGLIVCFNGHITVSIFAFCHDIRIFYGNTGCAGDIHFVHDNIRRSRNPRRRRDCDSGSIGNVVNACVFIRAAPGIIIQECAYLDFLTFQGRFVKGDICRMGQIQKCVIDPDHHVANAERTGIRRHFDPVLFFCFYRGYA